MYLPSEASFLRNESLLLITHPVVKTLLDLCIFLYLLPGIHCTNLDPPVVSPYLRRWSGSCWRTARHFCFQYHSDKTPHLPGTAGTALPQRSHFVGSLIEPHGYHSAGECSGWWTQRWGRATSGGVGDTSTSSGAC